MPFNISVRKVHPRQLINDPLASMMLAMFYAMEMQQSLGWSTEQRYMEMTKANIMISQGMSSMLIANRLDGMPMGIILYTDTDDKIYRRIDAFLVPEQFRGQGIGKLLLSAAKEDKILHTYATPKSVSWYLRHGFKEIGKHSEGTIEMTTGNENIKYTFKYPLPIFDEDDLKAIAAIKALESEMGISNK